MKPEQTNTAAAAEPTESDVVTHHPAFDADPRANTSAEQNRIEFNDPAASSQEAVERALKGE